ncbi:Prolyl 4-hydroxylase subunit alpha-2 [Araneus ventricosus]|uniref:Prolyl 4-hydroxylase subunit alpha-2 n=3 Tax=Araneus ventricosus TaxID=182803 RepID=A0A4Y2PSY4_ARAVE|nr:Prolyl 4-hydroxylase subunit alpha-2 [Araneus ventricosus]
MTRTTPELAPPSPNFRATPTGGRLATTYDLACNRPHTRRIFSGIGFRTCDPPVPSSKKLATLLIVFHLVCPPVSGELYSALAGMETLLDTQKVIVETLNGYIETTERKLDKIKKLQNSLVHLQNSSRGNFQEFVSNPINAFVLIKKLTVDWDDARDIMSCLPSNEISAGNVVFPDQDDLSGAAKALLRVQQTYSLDTESLSEGRILGAANGLPLSADDSFELGRQAFHAGFYDSAISWLELSQQKQFENGSDIRNSSEILTYLTMSEYQKERSEFMHLASSLLQLGFMSVAKPDSPLGGFLEKAVSKNIFVGHTSIFDEATYRKLCQSSMHALSAVTHVQESNKKITSHPKQYLTTANEIASRKTGEKQVDTVNSTSADVSSLNTFVFET